MTGSRGPALVAVIAGALFGQFLASVGGIGVFGIAQPGYHLSRTPGRDIFGGFVWFAFPGILLLAGAEVIHRSGHRTVAGVIRFALWVGSMIACFVVWAAEGTCASSDSEATCPGRSFVALGVVIAVAGLTVLAGAVRRSAPETRLADPAWCR